MFKRLLHLLSWLKRRTDIEAYEDEAFSDYVKRSFGPKTPYSYAITVVVDNGTHSHITLQSETLEFLESLQKLGLGASTIAPGVKLFVSRVPKVDLQDYD